MLDIVTQYAIGDPFYLTTSQPWQFGLGVQPAHVTK